MRRRSDGIEIYIRDRFTVIDLFFLIFDFLLDGVMQNRIRIKNQKRKENSLSGEQGFSHSLNSEFCFQKSER